MKHIFLYLLLFLSINLYALKFENNISIGNWGIGYSNAAENNNVYIHGCIINFTFQFENGIGFCITPFNVYSPNTLTFVNPLFFYNLFNNNENLILGPYASLCAMKLGKINYCELCIGLIFKLRLFDFFGNTMRDTIFAIDFINAEAGYKFVNKNNHGFYVQIGFDVLTLLVSINNSKLKKKAI